MEHAHHSIFVVLSLVVAVLGSWTALDLFRRVRSHVGAARRVWLAAAALAMGASIWSMHFIAMLGFDPGSPVSYDPPLTALSFALAVAATCGAFFAAATPRPSTIRLLAAGAAMGLGICLMHYVGMAALRTAVSLGYRPEFVVASLIIAVVASTSALFAARRERAIAWRAAASLILGLAIVGMHYTAMAGLTLTIEPGEGQALPGAPPFMLGLGVAGATLLILGLALLASLYDQRLNVLGALDAGGVGYWELSLPDMGLQTSTRARAIFGRSPDAPFTYDDLLASLSEEDRRRRPELLAAAASPGAIHDIEHPVLLADGSTRWVNIRGRVVQRRGGTPRRMVGVVLDISDRRAAFEAVAAAERRQRLLIDELNHRVKNTLAAVQSIARQTARRATSMETFRESFEARLMALSQTHNALTRSSWEHARLRELLDQELSPYAAGQCRLDGPDVFLRPREALALGMSFHELATNAAKYGALSTPAGRLDVAWRVGDGERLSLTWRERGGPPAPAPERQGFGTRLLHAAVDGELGGQAEIAYGSEGLTVRLDVPLRASPAPGATANDTLPPPAASAGVGR